MESRDGTTGDLIDMLFDPHQEHVGIGVFIPEAEHVKQLFEFCLDVFLKALTRVLLIENPDIESWDIANVSQSHIERVRSKLSRLGIVPNLTINEFAKIGVLSTNSEVIQSLPEDMKLSEYKFVVYDGIRGVSYEISFGEINRPSFPKSTYQCA